MSAAIRAELRKITSTRLWWVLLLAQGAYLGFIGLVMAFSFTVDLTEAGAAAGPALSGVDAATATYSLVNSIGYVFPLVIGSLAVTTEFRHRTIAQTLLVEPRRSVVLGAKLVATVPIGLLFGVVGVAALAGAAAPLLAWQGDGAFLTDPEVVKILVLGVVVMALWAVIGAAFGSVVTNQVAAIVGILAFTQFVEPIARLALSSVDGLERAARFLPGSAADAVVGASLFNEIGEGSLLSRPAGLAVLLAYAVGLAVVGRLTTLRRDLV
ncbi:ABC transporter permease [Nocardioides sp. dk4132]|uniref:ABC transporter permease n=1 Tax=unclassified Nocardioides TaxID=2615069 RepID=UPI001294DCE6|nr:MULTISPECIES: ABC transporter permease [unclassified Nocardioides]MQW76030.1 ABC transporter permease [Nocardioides sp. dk4132]QGA08881.1 ABC transporter permease [Nocardioides sp. dk884]